MAKTTPQSQLANTPNTTGETVKPVTDAGLAVYGYIKGGQAAVAVMLRSITLAIRQSLQNNPAAMNEIYKFAVGKVVKARAVQAGLVAIRDCTLRTETGQAWITIDGNGWRVAAVKYSGKLTDSVNKPARDEIDLRLSQLEQIFVNAFEGVFAAEKADKVAKQVAKEVNQKAAEAVKQVASPVAEPSTDGIEVIHHEPELSLDQQAQNVLSALQSGMLSDDAETALIEAVMLMAQARIAAGASSDAVAVH